METFSKFKIAKTIYWLGLKDFISLSKEAFERAQRKDGKRKEKRAHRCLVTGKFMGLKPTLNNKGKA